MKRHLKFITRFLSIQLFAAGLLLSGTVPLSAQPERRIVPRHDWAVELPELGRMTGLPEDGLFADKIYPVGDINRDSLCDWIVTRSRRDTMVNGKYPLELLLYRGKPGSLPEISERERIGPTEIGSETRFMAAGDWDGDGNRDLATAITVMDDPESDPQVNGRTSRLVIWWGQPNGEFSLDDTTRLSIETPDWIYPNGGFSMDFDHNGTEDLMLVNVWGWADGEVYQGAPIQTWTGERGKRWGHELPATSTWSWWNTPRYLRGTIFKRTQWIDQDVDGYIDFVWYDDSRLPGENATISIIYGTPEHILDTANIHTIHLDSAWGKYALFADITGDKVPELLVNTGGLEAIKAYVGFKRQRIEEQYGLGNEPGKPGEEVWWGKPWATIPLPGQLHDGWAASGWSPIYEFPDAGLDGVGDVWVFSIPDFICYNGGQRFDSIYDSWIRRPGTGAGATEILGDIDGSGVQTIAVVFGYTGTTQPDGIAFFQPTSSVPTTGKYRYMPPGTEKPESAVDEPESSTLTKSSLGLQVFPNPSSGIVRVAWRPVQGIARIRVSDQVGHTVTEFDIPASTGRTEWDASQTFGGLYFVTLEIDGRQETQEVRIQR